MKIHEYQAKAIISKYGVRVPSGKVIASDDEALNAARELNGRVVVKAQIHAGGRGKGGGVKVAEDPEKARDIAKRLLGKPLVTPQTGPNGRIVRRLLLEEALEIYREMYAGMVIDRENSKVTLILCGEGGMEIEEVAGRSPEKILRESIDPLLGLMPFQVRKRAYQLGLDKAQVEKAVSFLQGMYKAFIELDMSLIEINPLVLTKQGELVALDAKINFDDNALFRHADHLALRDTAEEEPAEVEASEHDLSYIRLDGNIGCMVNGAGLAMATMDIIKLFGGKPANFLDVGGGTDAKRVKTAFKIILSDPNVRAVLVNIFGGIVRCDVIAQGVVEAVSEVGIKFPLVVRLQGTKVAEGKEILKRSGLQIIPVETMKEAAETVVNAVRRHS